MSNDVILAEPAQASAPMRLLEAAVAQGADMAVLERLMDLHERHERNIAKRAFDEAMAAARGEFPIIKKNRTVDFVSKREGGGRTNYKHEDLAAIAEAINPVLANHGLSYRFRTTSEIGQPIVVTCIVSHRMGYSEENTLVGPRDDSGNKNAIQQIGSTLTYLQRMTLKAALGLAASDDDDGRASGFAETISDAQLEKLSSRMEEVGADPSRFCAYLQVESLRELPAARFDQALAALSQRARKA